MSARRRRRLWWPAIGVEARRSRARARAADAARAAETAGDRERADRIRLQQQARDAHLAARDGGVL